MFLKVSNFNLLLRAHYNGRPHKKVVMSRLLEQLRNGNDQPQPPPPLQERPAVARPIETGRVSIRAVARAVAGFPRTIGDDATYELMHKVNSAIEWYKVKQGFDWATPVLDCRAANFSWNPRRPHHSRSNGSARKKRMIVGAGPSTPSAASTTRVTRPSPATRSCSATPCSLELAPKTSPPP